MNEYTCEEKTILLFWWSQMLASRISDTTPVGWETNVLQCNSILPLSPLPLLTLFLVSCLYLDKLTPSKISSGLSRCPGYVLNACKMSINFSPLSSLRAPSSLSLSHFHFHQHTLVSFSATILRRYQQFGRQWNYHTWIWIYLSTVSSDR